MGGQRDINRRGGNAWLTAVADPNGILPGQFVPHRASIPERRLCVAILLQALSDFEGAWSAKFIGQKTEGDAELLKLLDEVNDWFFHDQGDTHWRSRRNLTKTEIRLNRRSIRVDTEQHLDIEVRSEVPFSFENICDILNLDMSAIRKALTSWKRLRAHGFPTRIGLYRFHRREEAA